MSSLLTEAHEAILSATPPADRRVAPRFAVAVPVEVSTADGVLLSTELTNISCSGFRTRSPMFLDKGTKLVLRLNGRLPRRAQVAWQKGEEIGCRFMRPLGKEQLAIATGL